MNRIRWIARPTLAFVGVALGLSACAGTPDYDASAFDYGYPAYGGYDYPAYGAFDFDYCGGCGDWHHGDRGHDDHGFAGHGSHGGHH